MFHRKLLNCFNWRMLFCAVLTVLCFSSAYGEQIKFRTGMMSASIGGAKSSGFSVAPIWNIEYEMPRGLKQTHFFSVILANDMATAQTKYFGLSYGHRDYFRGTISEDLLVKDMGNQGDYLKVSSQHRMFYDWSVGIGQLQSYVASLSLNSTSTTFDFGGGVGYEYQLTTKSAFTSEFHLAYAYGISSVAASGMLIEILIGATWQF